MKLINAETLVLEDFIFGNGQTPKYATLSHTWGEGEVTLQEFTNPDETVRSSKAGFIKIQESCKLAIKAGISHVWVDTCCIDKTSSAELTEAINSMFQWYREAEVCYTWLGDLAADADLLQLKDCRWFTRGWTLQELLAPRKLEFYDAEWKLRGTKDDLTPLLAGITRISSEVLKDPEQMFQLPIAQRMSWAAGRQTTRVEDVAYSLLGIFDVNMPMLYGEGTRAFQRLQEEIAKETNDLSLFAWQTSAATDQQFHGIFAPSPSEFKASVSAQLVRDLSHNPEYRISNKGLNLFTELQETVEGDKLLTLNCSLPTETGDREEVGIWVKVHGNNRYSRVRVDELGTAGGGSARSTHAQMYLFKQLSPTLAKSLQSGHKGGILLREGFNEMGKLRYPDFPFESTGVAPSTNWDSQSRMILTHGKLEHLSYVTLMMRSEKMDEYGLGPNGMAMLVVGKLEGEGEKPWAMVFQTTKLPELTGMTDNKIIASKVRELLPTSQQATMKKFMHEGRKGTTLSVQLVEDVVDGETVYCVDMAVRAAKKHEVDPNDS